MEGVNPSQTRTPMLPATDRPPADENYQGPRQDQSATGMTENDDSATCGCVRCSDTMRRGCTRAPVAVFSTFVVHFLVVGIMYSFGVFYVELLDYYERSPSSTSLIGSINSGACHAAAPLVGLIEARIGIRRTLIVGALISTLGLVVSSFVPSMFILYISYGVLSGIGFAIAYTASIGAITSHFSCQRSLDISVGIASSGQGFGLLAMPPLVRVVVDAYGWKGAMLLCGGLALNVCVCAAMSWPPEKKPNKERLPDIIITDEAGNQQVSKNRESICDIGPIIKLLKDKIFAITLVSEILSNMTLSTTLTTLPDFTRCHGHDLFQAGFLLSIYGITMTFGRLYLSFFAGVTKYKSNKRVSLLVTNLISALSVLCVGFTASSYPLLSLCTAIFGLVSGAKGTLSICFLIKLAGIRNTVLAMGMLGFSCGLGQFAGPPLAGMLLFRTGWYPIVYCFGALTSLLTVTCYIVIVILHRKSKSNEGQSRDNETQEQTFLGLDAAKSHPGLQSDRLKALGSTFSLTSLP